MKYTTFFIIAAGLLFSGCSTQSFKMFGESDSVVKTIAVSDLNYSEEVQFEWKIVKGDRVEINIANLTAGEGDQQLNQMLSRGGQQTLARDGTEGYLIANNGLVRLPLIGAVEIMGLTENQAAEKLSNLYKQYLRNPYVSIKILNQKLYVLGEVKSPGVVQVTNGTMTLFEALARSGDLTNDAERTNVRVIRGGLRDPQMREINLADMSQMKLTSLILQPNDIIYIQPRAMKAYNVAFAEQTPFFSMINTMMSPFLSAISLKNGQITNVVLFK
ncbi:MAG: polysaccharide biosynthesis/export family protein [Sulfuricurvum sp.]|nr:polysaccharide biosynthesis/export family protein [Sulfuricurvum sp.]MDP3302315.1 polysaccharide biosynthesis/export family protein [Sulfuricurvum sp.]